MEGSCQCGLMKFTTPLPSPLKIYVCHCTECRHQSSSAYGITCVFPTFEIPSPQEGGVTAYDRPNSNGTTRGLFCPKCGSRLMHQRISPEGKVGETVSVKGGCLDGLTKEMLDRGVHIRTRRAIVDIPAGVESFEGEPARGSFTEQ